ncbi:MAG: ABC transporter substrate-binding protein [Acetobacteraceae bacterium]|nr:ABC transporter substrate-binding protein [Acetobacteraceae bacterium]
MNARSILAAVMLATLTAISAQASDLTIVSRGGFYQEAQREIYFKPFTEATGIAIREQTWDGGIDVLRKSKDSATSGWDVVELQGDELLIGCEEGLLEKLDWSQIGGKDHYVPQGVSDCGVGTALFAFVLSWDKDKFPAAPSWADFWDVAKYPGKRGLRLTPKTNLEFALLADGVAPADVYRTLRTNDGVDRAFRKLDQLKPYIVWWQSGADAPKLLGSGEVLMTSAPNGRITVANRTENRNFGIQWTGSLFAVDSWGIMKGSPRLRQAYQFLYFVGNSAIEARLLPLIPYAGLAKGANDGLPPELMAQLPSNPANFSGGLPVDDQFWRDNNDKLTQRFHSWLEH